MSNEDSAILVHQTEWDQIVKEIDSAIEISLLSGKPDPAMALGRDLIRRGRLRGVQLARLLYEIDQIWNKFETDDRVEDAIERDMGIPQSTYVKYARMYKFVLRDRPQLAGKPMDGLIKITAAAKDGDFTDEHWKQIELAPTVRAMLEIRDTARETHTSGHNRLTGWCTVNGQLYCKRGDKGEIKNWGFVPRGSTDEDIKEMVERLDRIGVIFQLKSVLSM